MSREVTIVHLYPSEMNIYGDLGNILTLVKRLEWRGYQPKVVNVGVGDEFDMTTADIIFGGGGQDSGQLVVGADLLARAENLRAAAEAGVVMLVICGTYQLFGRFFQTYGDQKLPGIGILGAETVASEVRMIGNVIIKSAWGELVGFENHSGQTVLDGAQDALGEITKGYGNNQSGRGEGAIYKNVYGTYLHGPILPKNPAFADHLIRTALRRKNATVELPPLDDKLEHLAAEVAKSRPQ
jgi:CobQ-like glutamine amidotransferase family enzyme